MRKAFSAFFCILWLCSCAQTSGNKIKKFSYAHSYSDRVEGLIKKMTLDEKIGQMVQFNGFWDATGPVPQGGSAADKYEKLRSGMVGSMLNVKSVKDVKAIQKIVVEESRLGIPLIFGFDVIHGYKTLSPIPIAEAASWDLKYIEKSARTAATEATAAGLNWTFAPMMDISRDPRWGRVMEGGGEDPFLGSKIAIARVKGFQGNSLKDPTTIAACAKHLAGYGFAEGGRDYRTVSVSGSTLHNVILPPFKATVDAGIATVMNAFNDLNGVPATGNKFLQRDLLKEKWNFEGFVISDWGSIGELVDHGYSENLKEAAKDAAIAGSDMDMESMAYLNHLAELVKSGIVSMGTVDDAVKRILKVKEDLGLLDDPYLYCNEEREKEEIYAEKHRESVREMAKRSMVLLKNERNLLPLPKSGKKIAFIGPMVKDNNSPLGSWRIASDDSTAVTVWEGMKQYPENEYTYHEGVRLLDQPANFIYEVKVNETDRTGMNEAIKVAREADIVVLVLGEHGFQSGESRSRTSIDLPVLQEELMKKVLVANPNTILVLMNGRPLTINWAAENVPAILESWQLGTESGNAIAEVLMGDYNPSGKLPMTFPRNVGQIPIYYNQKSTGRPKNLNTNPDFVFWSHYSDSSNDPLYPFGYGLSYTTFEFRDLSVTPFNRGMKVQVTIDNTGDYDGEEVVQLYIHDQTASITRPEKELKGFEKIMIPKGSSRTVEFILGDQELGFYDNEGNYLVEPGVYDIMVGGNSMELLKTSVTTE